MPDIPESLVWIEQIQALQAYLLKNPKANRTELKDSQKLSNTQITYLLRLNSFDPAAIEKVRLTAQGSHPYVLSFKSAVALAGLKGKVTDLPTSFHAALDQVLLKRLPTRHIKALVDWVISGKPAAEFDAKAKPNKKLNVKSEELGGGSESEPVPVQRKLMSPRVDGIDINKLVELAKIAGAEEAQGDGQTAHQDELNNYLANAKSSLSDGTHKVATAKVSQNASTQMGTAETVAYDTLAGVSIIAKIKTKLKKGEKPTSAETLLLGMHGIWIGFHWLGKNGFKVMKWFLKEMWKFIKGNFKVLSKTVIGTIFKYACVIFVLWFLGTAYFFGISYPFRTTGNFIAHHLKWGNASSAPVEEAVSPAPATVVPTNSEGNAVKPSNENKKPAIQKRITASQPVYQTAHAWTEADEDAKQYEAELAALPNACRISDFIFAPGTAMTMDMVFHRLTDMANSEKYSMKIGHGTQKVLSVIPSSTNLTITYQDMIGGLLGGSSKMDFYWEDLKLLHCNLITPLETGAKPFYQLSFVVNGNQQPLVIQCSSAGDMGHLVSALNNFLKAEHLASVPMASLPYTLQGLRLNDKLEVTLLWTDSPAGKSGLKGKDVLWSLEKDTANQSEKKTLEAQLAALNTGTHSLYLVKPDDWTKAKISQSMTQSSRFNPKRQEVKFVIQ